MIRSRLFFLLGIMLIFLSLAMTPCALWSFIEGGADRRAFVQAIIITFATGFILFRIFARFPRGEPGLVENFTLVALAWFVAGGFAALPYFFYGLFSGSYIDAFFESLSGLTTTGATLIEDIEALPRGLLLWRSLTQWLGGMGIIVLFLAILPRFGFRSMTMFKAELPGPVAEKLVPRVVETARILWLIYFGLTVLETAALMFCGLTFYDALSHALTTMPTGGFSPYNASIAGLENPAAEVVITIFMFLAGVNFILFFQVLRRNFSFYKNPELRLYAAVMVLGTFLVAINYGSEVAETGGTVIRTAAFQVVSIVTTTGYATANFDAWPYFSRFLLLFLMFMGASGGSTGGSVKQIRWILLFKNALRELYRLIHPSAVTSVKVGGQNVGEEVLRLTAGFVFLYMIITALSTLFLSALGLDLETALSATAASIGNVGPGLAGVGPNHTYAVIPSVGRLFLALLMVVGRLEIYTVLVLFLPETRHLWGQSQGTRRHL